MTWSWTKGNPGLPFRALLLVFSLTLALAGCADMMADDPLQQGAAHNLAQVGEPAERALASLDHLGMFHQYY